MVARVAMTMAVARAVVTRQAMVARLVVVTPVGTPEETMVVMVWTRTRSRAIEGNGEICSPFFVRRIAPKTLVWPQHPNPSCQT